MRIFISMPMSGKTNEEIREQFMKITRYLTSKYKNQNAAVIDSICDDNLPNPLSYLAHSINLLATADAVYFAPNWDKYRGCIIEHECAEKYGLRILS